MVDVMRRWLGEQERHVSFCFGSRPERHVTLEVVCEPSIVGSLWLPPAWRLRSSASPLRPSASASHCGDAAHRAHYILDHVGTGERASHLLRQSEPRDGEDFIDAFEDRAGDPGPVSFETLGKIAKQLFGLAGVVQL